MTVIVTRVVSKNSPTIRCRPCSHVSADSAVLIILIALQFTLLRPGVRKRRQQVRFIRETLAAKQTFDDRRVIASLSTVPDRINNLRPTIWSLLEQTRPLDEIILAIPEFSIREQRRQKLNNETIAFFAAAWDVFASD